MNITFDPDKSAINLHKHGVSLSLAERIDVEQILCRADDRADYGEVREIGYAPIDGRIYCVVFTQRGEVFRVISLRKAKALEVRRYEQQI